MFDYMFELPSTGMFGTKIILNKEQFYTKPIADNIIGCVEIAYSVIIIPYKACPQGSK